MFQGLVLDVVLDDFDFWEAVRVFIKFCIVGFVSMVIDFAITWFCKEKLKANKFLANTLGFLISATFNFFINRSWTFHSHDADITSQFFRFLAVSTMGLLINNGVIYILNTVRGWNFYLAKLVATGITVIWNFGANRAITFSK